MSAKAERIDLGGKSLFPGFIDSHSHSIDGGLGLISADASEKVETLDQLAPFVDDAKKTGTGMRGDILEILGMPLEFWSHPDVLNAEFSTGAYEKQSVVLRGMDGHTAWANRALLQRAGITAEFLQKLSVGERSYYGADKEGQPNGFLVDAGMEKIEPLLPALLRISCWRRGGPPWNTTTALASRRGLIRWPRIMFCGRTKCWRTGVS